MNFPRFWAHGESGSFSSWRWSDNSPEEARSLAREAAARLEARFRETGKLVDRYGYPDRPLREPVLRELFDESGQVAHVITRNSYGCHVLNSARALFADVDLPEEHLGAAAIERARNWADSQPGWNWRIYRTKAGLRLLATQSLFDSADAICESVFAAVGADPLYRKLCQTQKCFRARLTPKPWRCEMPNPPARWPFADFSRERAFADWDARYQSACRAKATCQLLDHGTGQVHPELEPVIALHDEMTRATSGLALG
jgi:hypothetical protein